VTTDHVPHPGELLWADWLDPLELTVREAARRLGVTRKTLSAIINGRQGISPTMSARLGRALGVPADAWAKKQLAYDMATIDTTALRKVRRLTPAHFSGDVE
jgi:addiction module HigA family antidote